MKNKIILAVGVVLIMVLTILTGCSTNSGTQQPVSISLNSQQGIWVSGEGKVTVTPDIATINLGVYAKSSKVVDAQKEAAAAMDKLMSVLTASGIDKKDIQTQYYNIDQVTKYDNITNETIVTGYQVSNMVTVKIRGVDKNSNKTGEVIDAVVAATGDNVRISGITFSVDKPEQYYTQARELAMTDAKTKAQEMAKLSGVTLGKATYVTESTYAQPVYVQAYKSYDMAATGATTSISSGSADIILNVQVAYNIQ